MADADQGSLRGPAKELRQVPVDWEALEDAFENNAPEVHSYLHLVTGEVLRVVDGIADPDMHARIASDPHYMRVDPVSSREQYRWMERFIPMVDDEELQSRLGAAIDGKGAFRRFKDALMSFGPERERWFAFRSERLRVFMEAWLTAHGLAAIPRPAQPAEGAAEPEAETPTVSQAELGGGRRNRSTEVLRKQLVDVAETLGARDLEKVIAFAEFVKARRSARAFSHRHDESDPPPPGTPDGDSTSPSSQRRAAARS
jgi:hypothetical protein